MKKSVLELLSDCAPAGRRVRREDLLDLKNEGWEIFLVVGDEVHNLKYPAKRSYIIEDTDRSAKIIFVR